MRIVAFPEINSGCKYIKKWKNANLKLFLYL